MLGHLTRWFSRPREDALEERTVRLVGGAPVALPLCGQMATALAVDVPLPVVREMAGDEPLTPERTIGLLAHFGAPPRVVWGDAFRRFYAVHRERHGGDAFRGVAFDLRPDASQLGHAVYLHGEQLYDPATRSWRRIALHDLTHFDFVAILPERRGSG